MLKLSDLNNSFTPIADRWGTHVNLLKAVGKNVKTVLELGMGKHSTPLFLNPEFFPSLTKLVSVESNPEWDLYKPTSNHYVNVISEPIEPFLSAWDLNYFDLIFIDNSSSAERRIDTVKYISAHPSRSLVIMHDYDYQPYRDAVSGFSFVLVDDRQEPWTALLCR